MAAPAKPAQEKANPYAKIAKDFAAGGLAGTVSKTLTAPMERVKLIVQTQDANPKIISGEVKRYSGIVDAFRRLPQEQGFKAFWRGNLTNCIRYFPTQALNLSSKDAIKGMFPRYNPKSEFWSFFAINLLSGGASGAFSLMFVYPLDYARTRLATDVGKATKTFNGLWDCLVKTSKGPKGILGLYQGFGVSVAGIIPYRGVQFGLNDTIKGLNPYDRQTTPFALMTKWAGAQFSVIMSGFATYPFDTIRRRLQMEAEKPKDQRLYQGTMHCLRRVIKEEGSKALFKGAGANILRGTGAALVLVLYSELQKIMNIDLGGTGGE